MILLILGFFFALFRELSEHAKESGFTDWGRWWNTSQSWTNKHEWGKDILPSWFFGSFMVWITDAEHFFQLLSMLCVLVGVYYSGGILEDVIYFYAGHTILGGLKGLSNLR